MNRTAPQVWTAGPQIKSQLSPHTIAVRRIAALDEALQAALASLQALPYDDDNQLNSAIESLSECAWRIEDAAGHMTKWYAPQGEFA